MLSMWTATKCELWEISNRTDSFFRKFEIKMNSRHRNAWIEIDLFRAFYFIGRSHLSVLLFKLFVSFRFPVLIEWNLYRPVQHYCWKNENKIQKYKFRTTTIPTSSIHRIVVPIDERRYDSNSSTINATG